MPISSRIESSEAARLRCLELAMTDEDSWNEVLRTYRVLVAEIEDPGCLSLCDDPSEESE